MSLAIDIDKVQAVLLADGWHNVAPLADDEERSSFDIAAYEYVDETTAVGNFGFCRTAVKGQVLHSPSN